MTRHRYPTRVMRLVRACVTACGLWLATTGTAGAQGLDVGVKGGVNLATIRFDSDAAPASTWRSGIVGGGFVVIPLPWILEAQVEGLYVAKGTTIIDRSIESTLLTEYFEVPALLRLARGPRDRNIYVVAGPALAVCVRARTRVDIGGAIEEIDVSEEVERVDLGMVVGGGFTRGRLVVEGRYTLGVRDVDAEDSDLVAMKNSAISITAGFRF